MKKRKSTKIFLWKGFDLSRSFVDIAKNEALTHVFIWLKFLDPFCGFLWITNNNNARTCTSSQVSWKNAKVVFGFDLKF